MIRKLIVLLHSDWSRTTWFQMKCPLAHLKSIKTCCIFKKREEGTNRNWKKKKTCKEKNKNEKQRTLLQLEIDVVGKKICDVQKNCDVFDLEFVSSMMEADKIKRSSLCPQGKCMKKKK